MIAESLEPGACHIEIETSDGQTSDVRRLLGFGRLMVLIDRLLSIVQKTLRFMRGVGLKRLDVLSLA